MIQTYHVYHILAKARYEAEDLLKKLSSGSDFLELAKQFSICASAPRGGDLGILKTGQADSDFEEAALALAPGKYSGSPVRTKFGYHIILRKT